MPEPLKGIVENLEDVDESVRGLYTEHEKGGFRLNVTGVEFEPDVKSLKNALRTEKRLREASDRQLARIPADFDAEKWEEFQAHAESKNGNGGDPSKGKGGDGDDGDDPKTIASLKKRLEEKYQKEIKERDDKLAELEGREKNRAIRDHLGEAMNVIGVTDPIYRKAAIALMKERGVDATLDNGEYQTTITDEDGQVVAIGEYVKTWAKTEEAERFMPASGATGGGGKGSGSSGGSGAGGTGTIRSKADFKSQQDRLDFIEKHGSEKYLALPGELPANLRAR